MDLQTSKTTMVAALGRPFSLGMLYDSRQDSLLPGMTLWNRDDLKNHIRERPKSYNDFQILASESVTDKTSALNVEASLKASFFSGLIEVEGSAKYLHDDKTSKNQARVTLKYEATTKFQELSMEHLGNMKYPHVFEQGIATHVVTGVLYGAKAFFVFDRDVSDDENNQDIEGSLRVMIKKIPGIVIEGSGSVKLEDGDAEKVKKFSCKFHGDFLLEKTPSTFEEAVEVYQSLPGLVGENGENAVPMKVWLFPLTNLDSNAAKLVRQISKEFVDDAQAVLEDFGELEVRCNDALQTLAQQFPQIGKKLKRFKEMSGEFKVEFQRNLAKMLPSIRGGGAEEAALAEILEKRVSSPFNNTSLNEWLDCKEREMYTVMSVTGLMKNIRKVTSQIDLYKEVLSVEHAVCFVFTSLGEDEPYLSALSNYLKGTQPGDPQDPQSPDVEKEQWYASKEVMDAMRTKAKLFSDFAEANKENKNTKFLTAGLTDETHKGSTIYLYKDGFTVSENFEPPSKPESVTAAQIGYDSVTLKISPPRYGAENITSYSAEFCISGEDEWKQKEGKEAGGFTVSGLTSDTEYVFRCRAVTPLGVGPASEITIRTRSFHFRRAEPAVPGDVGTAEALLHDSA
ncbi:cytolytic toxin-alpha-like [Odontesthes bonariensis]|uniref:cytolytic toxin-alpha-like n=1 Tax=Odontesthes bonariensis TaxID=219752 RepID=UPI003F58E7C7